MDKEKRLLEALKIALPYMPIPEEIKEKAYKENTDTIRDEVLFVREVLKENGVNIEILIK